MEAPERSGALITANRALDQGRDVFVIPGQVGDRRCAGSNLLLRDGAGVVTDAWDVLRILVDLFERDKQGEAFSALLRHDPV